MRCRPAARSAIAAALASLATAAVALADASRAVPTPTQRRPVTGLAVIEGAARSATIRWSWERDGEPVESTSAPKILVTRLSSNVPLMMVKLPSELFGIKIGEDMQRFFDEPLVVDNRAEATCSCGNRDDCGSGRTFRCEVEAWLIE